MIKKGVDECATKSIQKNLLHKKIKFSEKYNKNKKLLIIGLPRILSQTSF